MISSEMPELIGMSDRIVVMSNGENASELSKGEYDQTHLLKWHQANYDIERGFLT